MEKFIDCDAGADHSDDHRHGNSKPTNARLPAQSSGYLSDAIKTSHCFPLDKHHSTLSLSILIDLKDGEATDYHYCAE